MKGQNFLAFSQGRKFIFIIILGFITLGSIFWVYSQKKENLSDFNNNSTQKLAPAIAEEVAKDSDNDGLKDWEETLWKTDQNNPDTDGDGASDGQEIKENRNPLVSGPNDDFLKTVSADKLGAAASSLTNTVSKQFISEILKLKDASEKQKGSINPDTSASSIVSLLSQSLQEKDIYEEIYKLKDLKISSKSDPETIKNFGNEFAALIKKYFNLIRKDELELATLQKALSEQNEKEFQKLRPISFAYLSVGKEGINLEAPKDISESYLAVLNSFLKISEQIDQMAQGLNDPLLAAAGFKKYLITASIAFTHLRILNNFFENKSIVFGEEPGKIFAHYK